MPKRMSRVIVRYGTDDPPGAVATDTFVVFPNVISVVGPDFQKSEAEVTDNDSGDFKDFLGDRIDAGNLEISFNVNLTNTAQQAVRNDPPGRQRNWQVDYLQPDGVTVDERFDVVAEVFNTGRDASIGQAVQGTLTLRISGQPVLTNSPP